MEQKKRNGHARHGKHLLGLLMALAMLGVLFMPVYATNDAESTAPAETVAQATYNFYVNVNDAAYDTQTLKDGEELQKPADPAPTQENMTFAGWFTAADEAGEEFTAFGPVAVEEDKTVDLYAHWTSEQPTTEQPADEQPTDDHPTEDKPADETPDEETPTAEETPATTPAPTTTPDTLETPDDAANEPVVQAANLTVAIEDTVTSDGRLTLKVTTADGTTLSADELTAQGYKIEWTKNEALVVRTEKMEGKYNMAEDASWVNVAYDKGAQCKYEVTISDGNNTYKASAKVNEYDSLQNGSFEEPACTNKYEPRINSGEHVWKTTASEGKIEIVSADPQKTDGGSTHKALSEKWHGMTKAQDGTQYAELNADEESSLYQDVLTEPGSTMNWQAYHAARLKDANGKGITGTDVMYVVIMDAKSAEALAKDQAKLKNIAEQLAENYPRRSQEAQNYYNAGARSFKCENNKPDDWKYNSGTYKVPEGQFYTRYFFVSQSSAANDTTIGNQLDDVKFTTDTLPPAPGTGSIVVTKKVYGLDLATAKQYLANPFITYNDGGSVSFSEWHQDRDEQGNTYVTAQYVVSNINLPSNTDVLYTFTETVSNAQVPGYGLDHKEDFSQDVTLTKEKNLGDVTFTNTYTPSTVSLTVKKIVTGGLGDKTKQFEFICSYNNVKFPLKNGETYTLENIPIGTEVTVTETNATGYTTSYNINDNGAVVTDDHSCVVTVTENSTIAFTNHKDVNPDTGVLLDSMPYVIILIVVAAGIVGGVVLKKRKHGEDDV